MGMTKQGEFERTHHYINAPTIQTTYEDNHGWV